MLVMSNTYGYTLYSKLPTHIQRNAVSVNTFWLFSEKFNSYKLKLPNEIRRGLIKYPWRIRPRLLKFSVTNFKKSLSQLSFIKNVDIRSLSISRERSLKTHKNSTHEHRYREASVVAGSPSPYIRKYRRGGLLCMYYGCENEARHICPYCYLLFCDEHKEPGKHQCNPLHRELNKLKNISRLKRRLAELSEELTVNPRFEYLWKIISRKQLFQKIAPVALKYRDFFQDFIEKAFTMPQSITKCNVLRFIYARLIGKLLEYSNRFNEVIVMDHNLLEELSTGDPYCDPRLAGLAFQWWITLEILDTLRNKGYLINNIELFKRRVSVIRNNKKLILYLDSGEVMSLLGLRPDILSTKDLRIAPGKVIEVKLSYNALRNSQDQIIKYIRVWGQENIIVAVAFPPRKLELTDYYIEVIDSIILKDKEDLQKVLNKLVDHLISYPGIST